MEASRSAPDGCTLEPAPGYSLLRVDGFAGGHAHAFVVRGARSEPLFKPGPVPGAELCRAAGLAGAALHLPRQVHGATAVEVPAPPGEAPAGGPPVADALVTRAAGHAAAVATADCLPLLIAAPSGACAAVHAGWRGLLAGVIEAAIARLRGAPRLRAAGRGRAPRPRAGRKPSKRRSGLRSDRAASRSEREVAERFLARFPGDGGFLSPAAATGKSCVDLVAAARRCLGEAGVPARRVRSVGLCTRCGEGLLESFRRDGDRAGRMIALIGPRA